MHCFLEKCIKIKTHHNDQQIKIKSASANLKIRTFRSKNEDEDIFHLFSKTFLTNQGKNEDEDQKIWRISLIFEFTISK